MLRSSFLPYYVVNRPPSTKAMTEATALFENVNYSDSSSGGGQLVDRILSDVTDMTVSTTHTAGEISPISFNSNAETSTPLSDGRIVPELEILDSTDECLDYSHLYSACHRGAFKEWVDGKK